MRRIALVAFRGTIAAKVMTEVKGFDIYEVGSSQRLIEVFCKTSNLQPYSFIVGMGVFTHQKGGFVHVEKHSAAGELNGELADGGLFRVTQSLGTSWCALLVECLQNAYPNKELAFLHIPTGSNVQNIVMHLQLKLDQLSK